MYCVYVGDKAFSVFGCEAAYEAYKAGKTLACLIGVNCSLVDANTGEIIADMWDD